MAKKLDPRLLEILTTYGERPEDALWDCHGTWVAYHAAIERIAAKAGIKYDPPSVLVAEKEAAAILVSGTLNDRSEWTVGEAVINLNYRVSGKQAAYPFAMAEKRAKDRLTLKLIGLHGLVYSEEESDDFKPEAEAAKPKSSAQLKRDNFWPDFERELDECGTLLMLEKFRTIWRERAMNDGWTAAWKAAAKDRIEGRERAIMNSLEASELAQVPLETALKNSVLLAG